MVNKYVKEIQGLCGRYSEWEVWGDFVSMSAAALANPFDLQQAPEREKDYLKRINKYKKGEQEKFGDILGMVVMDLEKCPGQDLLGEIYMELSINSKTKAQYFTPYYISDMMSNMIIGTDINPNEPQIINEPTCGSGVNLIAAAHTMRKNGFNYQKNAYFVAQDMDSIAAKMCFIQMSLLGMPGVVFIGDTLAKPLQGDAWYTPFHFLYGIHTLARRRKREPLYQTIEVQGKKEPDNELDDWVYELLGFA